MSSTYGAAVSAMATLTLLAVPLSAQSSSVQATARVGIAIPSDEYQRDCGASSLALGLDLQSKGRVFPQLSLDYFSGSGGGDVACIPVLPSVGTGVGGMRLDGATRGSVGAGARVGRGTLQLEGVVLGGFVAGRPGFVGAADSNQRKVMPHVGGQAALVLFRYAVVSAAANWTRLSLDVVPASGGAGTRRVSWAPMTTLQVGARVPLSRR